MDSWIKSMYFNPYSYKKPDNIKELKKWNSFSKKMILTGMLDYDEELNNILNKISESEDVIVLSETNSNLNGEKFISSIDKVISGIGASELKDFQPDLLITIGHNIISKMIKSYRNNTK